LKPNIKNLAEIETANYKTVFDILKFDEQKLLTTWGFMQVGLDKLSFNKLQSRAVVRAGQTSLVINS